MKMVAINDAEIVAPSSSSSMTIWVGGTSALAQTYVEEILLLQKNKNDDNDARNNSSNNNNNRYFILASPDPPIIMDDTTTKNTTSTISSVSTTKKCFSYQKLDMTKRNSIDAFFDRILMTMARMMNNNNNEKYDYGHDDGTTTTTTTTTTTRSTPTPTPTTIIKITIIFGMRASLVTGTQIDHLSLVEHVPYFIEQAKLKFSDSDEKQEILLTGILHVSSVAVMDHTKCQSMLNEDDSSSSLPDSPSCYSSPYDLMKRQTEDVITSACKELDLIFVHLRISGIFSNEGKHHYDYQVEEQDDDNNNNNNNITTKTISTGSKSCSCIQMSAIRIQAFIGSYIQTPLDMNTSRNVCHTIRLILNRMDEQQQQLKQEQERTTTTTTTTTLLNNVYFYTRPTILPKSYGDNLISYRTAHNIWYAIDVPDYCFARIIIWTIIYLFQILVSSIRMCNSGNQQRHHQQKQKQSWYDRICSQLQNILSNVSYLLTVSMVEHTFDNSRIRNDFPEISLFEESILEGFIRIKKRNREAN